MLRHPKSSFTGLLIWLLLAASVLAGAQSAPLTLAAGPSADAFPLVRQQQAAPLYVDAQDAAVVRLAAEALAKDVAAITGTAPALRPATAALAGYSVIVGTLGHSALVDQLAAAGQLDAATLREQWESFSLSVVDRPLGQPGRALVIAGSDRRGTAFGVFELSRRLGVSPWVWWADAAPRHQTELYLVAGRYVAPPPTVKYRGIFLNDEDWGLQPWAAQNLDKDIKDIGSNTYARLFELLLRLKANLIWPAMHPSTRAFFHYPGNPEVADRYAILVGTSHAEPMLRNNVDEWHEATMGPFDYFRNRPAVYEYWAQRAREAGRREAMYSLGMRGVHDSGMLGAKTPQEAAQMLSRVLADQREILRRYVAPDPATVPQVFTAYKEVLDVYDAGLKLPDDVILAWPDDNYGYISRLSNAEEQQRPGGSGVYYHASYWGRPHDYLWLSSTHPALIREEMMKAYEFKTRSLWVLNVGDLKPLEYNTQLFLDMAYDARPFAESQAGPAHLQQWAQTIFGSVPAAEIGQILTEYYDLAFERRPEFMGWSQTEPTTPTHRTQYNHFYYGDEAQRRLDRYAALLRRVRQLRPQLPPALADAYYELVYYPVAGATWLNQKFLYQDKASYYARQNRASAATYAAQTQLAYDSIAQATAYYNQQLAGGKWRGMMNMHPRSLPVFQAPAPFRFQLDTTQAWGVLPEGFATADSALVGPPKQALVLPTFQPWGAPTHFLDVFLSGRRAVSWKVSTSAKWLLISAKSGRLTAAAGQQQQRLLVSVDWRRVPTGGEQVGFLTFKGAGKTVRVAVRATLASPEILAYEGFIETNGYVAMQADHYTRKVDSPTGRWVPQEAVGRPGQLLAAQKLAAAPADSVGALTGAAVLEYDFYALSAAARPVVTVATLPVHPATRQGQLRYGVALDGGPVTIVDHRTEGRSDEWKQNVLRNSAQRSVAAPPLGSGRHTLKIYLLDPGVLLDRLTIDLGGLVPAYGAVPETRRPQ
jgi:hypothetical protein